MSFRMFYEFYAFTICRDKCASHANDLGMPVQNYTGMRAHRPEFTGQDQELKSAPKKKLGENRSAAW